MSMFCFQCQETAAGKACTMRGVCGKTADVANLQDLLIFVLKGVAFFTDKAAEKNKSDDGINRFFIESLFSTITNANFDREAFIARIKKAYTIREKAQAMAKEAGADLTNLPEAAIWKSEDIAEMEAKALTVGVLAEANEDIRSLKQLITYGLKGMAAYAEHAHNLGYKDEKIFAFMQKTMAAITSETIDLNQLIALTMETGKHGVEVMALLDKANTTTYGNPEISKVNLGVRNNPAILVSGHDLKDFEELLIQTEGTGIDIYTHSEMLPANYYPNLKKYKHLVGNYGNAWWKQDEEFEKFNGPILMTTN